MQTVKQSLNLRHEVSPYGSVWMTINDCEANDARSANDVIEFN